MTVAVIIGIVALICVTVISAFVAVTFRQALSDASRALERIESRHQGEMSTVLDRLMTIKWEDLVAVRSVDEPDEGGFIPPEQQGDEPIEVIGGKWGHLSTLRERLRLTTEEEQLLNEDFPDDVDVDVARRRQQAEERGLV